MRWTANITFVLCLLVMLSCKESRENLPVKPNIILILADDLGYGDLGCYGQQDIRTPVIDKLANEGMRFINHYAGSTVCAPSRCALMTGLHMGHARIRGNANIPLQPEDVTVAELLKNEGYATAMFGKWGLGRTSNSGQPNKQGFDLFVGYNSQVRAHNAYPGWIWENSDTLWLDNEVEIIPESYAAGVGGVALEKNTHTQDVFTDEALRFIEENRDSPFFLYLPYTLPHANNEAWYWDMIGMEVPDMMGYDTVSGWPEAQQAFAATITYLDKDVGRIIDKLKELNIDERTLLLFSSDNGPHKEGGNDPEISKSSGPLRGIKRDLYEGGIRIPLVAWWPGTIEANSESEHISAFWDFLPTVCEAAGIPTPENIDGISYLPALLSKDQRAHDHLYWEFYEQNGKQAVRMGNWKGVRLNVNEDPGGHIELYDLSTDMGETRDISQDHPEIVQRIDAIMDMEHTYSSEFNFPHERDVDASKK